MKKESLQDIRLIVFLRCCRSGKLEYWPWLQVGEWSVLPFSHGLKGACNILAITWPFLSHISIWFIYRMSVIRRWCREFLWFFTLYVKKQILHKRIGIHYTHIKNCFKIPVFTQMKNRWCVVVHYKIISCVAFWKLKGFLSVFKIYMYNWLFPFVAF